MDILTQLQEQTEQHELLTVRGEATKIAFEANHLKRSEVEESSGMAVRVIKDGRLGFAASTDAGASDKLVENALQSAAMGEAVPLDFPGAMAAPTVRTYDGKIEDLPAQAMVELGQGLVEQVLAVEPEARVNLEINRGVNRLTLRNSAGADVGFVRTPLSVSYEISRVKGDDVLLLFGGTGATVWTEELRDSMREACGKLRLARQSAALSSGRMPVLFAPTGTLALVLPLLMGLSGKNVHTKTSPLTGKVGEKLFDDKLTVVDDPTLSGRLGSAAYDDEGVAHRRNVLIEAGTLRRFYYDLKTAAQDGTESTGNGGRSLFAPPSPALSNVVVGTGTVALADMLAGVEHGLWVEDPLGLGQGNVLSGAFSNSLSLAYVIEKGEIAGRVKDVSIAGNVYEVLRDISAVSRESAWVYGSYCLPYMLISNLNDVAKA